jgi:hypothetical protein
LGHQNFIEFRVRYNDPRTSSLFSHVNLLSAK